MNGTNEHYELLNLDNTVVVIELSKMQVRDMCSVDNNCSCVCVCARARACMLVRKGLVLRVCLRVRRGAPHKHPALDPPLQLYCQG